MTLSDEILELSVELNRAMWPDIEIVTDLEVQAQLIRSLPIDVTVTKLTAIDINVNKELHLDSSVNRWFLWEIEL